MQNQQTITVNTPVHVKAAYNGEFRRFLLTPVTYAKLEILVQTLFKLPHVSLKFEDDEKDWVLVSTDDELLYAVELAGSPLRLNVQVIAEKAAPVLPPTESVTDKKCWKGQKKGQCKGWNKRERLEATHDRLTKKIACLEEKVKSEMLPTERERAVRWRISRLQEKLEFVSACLGEATIDNQTPVCKTEEPKPEEGWAGRGKCCRRRREEGWTPRCRMNERLSPEIFENFRQAKAAFLLAKESGNREEIQACRAAWIQAKQEKWAAKDQFRTQKFGEDKKCFRRREEGWTPRCRMNEHLSPEILENFRKAKAAFLLAKESGNREEIQACRAAWIQAKQAKWAAKDQLRAQKFGEDRK